MILDNLVKHTSEWLKGTGPNSDIVISSRIRLARNLENIPFPQWADKKQAQGVLEEVFKASSRVDFLKNTLMLKMADLNNLDKQFLIERHLISREQAMKVDSKGIVVDQEEIISIMINEEDHLRTQVIRSGFDLFEAWNIINQIDDLLSSKLNFAYSDELGYLTACPTNTGTGMRGSVMLHLPALVITMQINKILSAVSKLGFTTRGLYGEGTQAQGNFFQISNQVSLGQNEEGIIDKLNGLIRQVIEQEEQARKLLINQKKAFLEDRIGRSLGILKSAYIITSQETTELLSWVRLGCDLGIISNLDRVKINELFILIQPAHLQKLEGRILDHGQRDVKRASIIREKLK
ncbi:MAG: protein arginine kinase [Candidatus Omnitrophota bacterium]